MYLYRCVGDVMTHATVAPEVFTPPFCLKSKFTFKKPLHIITSASSDVCAVLR